MFTVLILLLVFGGLGITVYYLFFTPTPLIDKFVPLNLKSLKEISSIKIKPEGIMNNPNFQVLREYSNPIPEVSAGRSNPFAPTR